MLKSFSWVRAASVEEAVEQLRVPGTRIHAGGTDLLGCMRDGVFDVSRVVGVGAVAELSGVRQGAQGGLRIGALTRLSDVERHPLVRERWGALAQAAAAVGTPQLRSQGTLGGNLCQKTRCAYYRGPFDCRRKGGDRCYAASGNNEGHAIFGGVRCHMVHPSDTAAALAALDATVVVEGTAGRRTVPIGDFFVQPSTDPTRETVLEPDEIVVEVVLPSPGERFRSSYAKVRPRRSWDFALAGVALAVRTAADGTIADARVVLSGVAAVPWRSSAVEDVLIGARPGAALAREAAEAAVAGARPLRDNAYKVELVRGLVEREVAAMS